MGTHPIFESDFDCLTDMSKIFIGNLPDRARGVDVEDFLSRYGKLREISLKNGYGFVEFDDSRDAEDAVRDMNGERLCGERVTIEMAKGGGRGAVVVRDLDHAVGARTGIAVVVVVAVGNVLT